MKKWLYKKDETAKIFEDEAINTALENGWVDSPAKCGTAHLETYKGKTAQGLTQNYSVSQLRDICKSLGLKGLTKSSMEDCAEAITEKTEADLIEQFKQQG